MPNPCRNLTPVCEIDGRDVYDERDRAVAFLQDSWDDIRARPAFYAELLGKALALAAMGLGLTIVWGAAFGGVQ